MGFVRSPPPSLSLFGSPLMMGQIEETPRRLKGSGTPVSRFVYKHLSICLLLCHALVIKLFLK